MIHEVTIQCPECGHTTTQEMQGGQPLCDLKVKHDGEWRKAEGRGFMTCNKCDVQFAYRIGRPIVCFTSPLSWMAGEQRNAQD